MATWDDRYYTEIELEKTTLPTRMALACLRQFQLTIREPIVILFSLYTTVIYIVLFTFLDGYTFIFTDIHYISQGLNQHYMGGDVRGNCCRESLCSVCISIYQARVS